MRVYHVGYSVPLSHYVIGSNETPVSESAVKDFHVVAENSKDAMEYVAAHINNTFTQIRDAGECYYKVDKSKPLELCYLEIIVAELLG